ncbi:hypothetical protein [Nesterenkonia muleiensis]|uniref:hypothetical protein n=1 Tax=Nesterenkonia muleiensis TaxID=2282648 RepID=UPI000E70BB60|nr:hypothetical protein [Nesterenkonia muleiensis]
MNSEEMPAALLARRRLCTVVVDGLDILGLHLADQLVHLRLGTVILRDDSLVDEQVSGFRAIDRGRPRAEAAAELIGARAQQTAVVEAPEGATVSGADLHIVTGHGSLPAQVLRRAAKESPAVLPVLASSSGWCVGPLLLHNSPVCVECLDGSGLLTAAPGPIVVVPHPLMLAAAAVAAQQAQVLVDGVHRCLMEQAALIGEADTGMIMPTAVRPGLDCACLTRVEPR